ncbi:MAG TPA: threonine/serine exporter family protein [Clostridia bacterium]|nr:threonine/serine exporter family protein [Clostridia bacterium]
MAVLSEILARVMKMPATIFMIPAIIPLVPGVGLYQTMMFLVQQQDNQAAKTGTTTLLSIVAMAMAMVFTAILTQFISAIAIMISHKKNPVN